MVQIKDGEPITVWEVKLSSFNEFVELLVFSYFVHVQDYSRELRTDFCLAYLDYLKIFVEIFNPDITIDDQVIWNLSKNLAFLIITALDNNNLINAFPKSANPSLSSKEMILARNIKMYLHEIRQKIENNELEQDYFIKMLRETFLGHHLQFLESHWNRSEKAPFGVRVLSVPESKQRWKSRGILSPRAEKMVADGKLIVTNLMNDVCPEEEAIKRHFHYGVQLALLMELVLEILKDKLNFQMIDYGIDVCVTERGTSGSFGGIMYELLKMFDLIKLNVYKQLESDVTLPNNYIVVIVNCLGRKRDNGTYKKLDLAEMLARTIEEYIQANIVTYIVGTFPEIAFPLEELIADLMLQQISLKDLNDTFANVKNEFDFRHPEDLEYYSLLENAYRLFGIDIRIRNQSNGIDKINEETTFDQFIKQEDKTSPPGADKIKAIFEDVLKLALQEGLLLHYLYSASFSMVVKNHVIEGFAEMSDMDIFMAKELLALNYNYFKTGKSRQSNPFVARWGYKF